MSEASLAGLVKAGKACRICVARDPGEIRPGSERDFDPDVVSYWSQWMGHANPDLLIVGQDFGDTGYFDQYKGKDSPHNQTNQKLLELLRHAGLSPSTPPERDDHTSVFLTNSILCLKNPPMNKAIKARWVRSCATTHLRPLLGELNPRVVVAMGAAGWMAARLVLGLNDAPQGIRLAAGRLLQTSNGVWVCPVGHCGGLGLANRSWTVQVEDWTRIGALLRSPA